MDVKQYYGPGYWSAMHIDSFNAKTYEEKITCANTIARLISKFPCLKCRRHATEYASHHPFVHTFSDPDPLSLFKWTVNFHNAVNKRLDKPIIPIKDAVKKWGDESICIETSCIEEDD